MTGTAQGPAQPLGERCLCWQDETLHWVARNGDTRFAIAGSGSRIKTVFQLAQELLNASPDHQWALVTNGRTIRLLRDAATLTRPSYLDIDLQDLLSGQRFAEFAYVWRLLHASRARGLGGLARSGQGGGHPRARWLAPERDRSPHHPRPMGAVDEGVDAARWQDG